MQRRLLQPRRYLQRCGYIHTHAILESSVVDLQLFMKQVASESCVHAVDVTAYGRELGGALVFDRPAAVIRQHRMVSRATLHHWTFFRILSA
jgi:hypothetical protein